MKGPSEGFFGKGMGRSFRHVQGSETDVNILHVANSSDRLSMFAANLLVVEMGIWGGGVEGGGMNRNKTKKSKRIYVAGKVGKSTQVHRKGSNRCFCRRLLSPHSDRTSDYSHRSCCSVYRHILKTGQVSPVTQNRILNSASLLVY